MPGREERRGEIQEQKCCCAAVPLVEITQHQGVGPEKEDSGSKSETERGGEGVHRDGSRALK